MGEDDKREQVFWHIAPKQAEYVAELIHKAINFYLQGDLGQWYWTLTGLRELINFDLSETERSELDQMEGKTQKSLRQFEIFTKLHEEGRKIPLEIKEGKRNFSLNVKLYQRKIFDFLKEIGYFPDKEDRTKLGF